MSKECDRIINMDAEKYSCDECGVTFSRRFNLNRHCQVVHKQPRQKEEPIMEDDEDDIDQEEDVDTDATEDDEQEEEDVWRTAIALVQENLSFSTNVAQECILPEFIAELREIVEDRMDFARKMEANKLYESIMRRKDKYIEEEEENGYDVDKTDEDVATETAWNDRKYAIKKVIEENIDLFKKKKEPEETIEHEPLVPMVTIEESEESDEEKEDSEETDSESDE